MVHNVISVIDGAAGSCGKAKVIGEIATDKNINLGAAITNCMPNAGHSFVDENGTKTIFRNIPVSAVNPNTELFIAPGSAIDMKVFEKEYEEVSKYLGERKIYVHEMVPLIEDRHKDYEKEHIKSGSTFKGGGGVSVEKIIRDENLKFFKDYKNAICLSNDEWFNMLYKHLDNSNEYVMLEGSQGCDLSINHSGNYPYTTSRNVSTMQLLSDSGIPADRLLQTIMVIRPFPIRINNITNDGKYMYTGNYGSGRELTWSEINIASLLGEYPYEGFIEDAFGDVFPTDSDKYKKIEVDSSDILFEPSIKDFEEAELHNTALENLHYIQSLFSDLPKEYQDSILNDDRDFDMDYPTLIDCLEIERLYHKYKNSYLSNIDLKNSILFFTREIDCSNLSVYHSEIINRDIPDLSEITTVTKKERRIFDLDINKLKNNCRINTPSSLYLNFFEHLFHKMPFFQHHLNNQ